MNTKRVLLTSAIITFLCVVFQNCGPGGGFSTLNTSSFSSDADSTSTPPTSPAAATPSPTIVANAKYVSPSGDNANDGSAQSPWKTINYGVSKLNPGDTLYVRGGIYFETVYISRSGTAMAPLQIAASPGELPILDGANISADWSAVLTLQGDYIHASGFEVRNANMKGAFRGGYGIDMLGQHNTASKMAVHDTWEQGVLARGDYSILEDSQIWKVAYANCRATGCTSIYTNAGGWPSCVSACRDPLGNSITDHAILRRNIVHDCWGEGVSSFEADGTIIEDNTIYDNWAVNLYLSDTPNAVVQRNIVYNTPNNLVGKKAGFVLADERSDKPRSMNNKVINNFIYNADFCAFCWTGVPNSGLNNVLIANNTIVDGSLSTGAGGGDAIINVNSQIKNNIILGAGSSVPSSSGITFSNNNWATTPSQAVSSTDVVGDPRIARTGTTTPGTLTGAYFKILSGSPVIGKGVVLPEVPIDFFGTSRNNRNDIGGHQF